MSTQLIVIIISIIFLQVVGVALLFYRFLKIAPQGFVLIRSGHGGTLVAFDKLMVFPTFHKLNYLDIRNKHLDIVCENEHGVICHDNSRVNLRFRFTLQVSPSEQSILQVAQSLGCKRAGQIEVLQGLFDVKFLEAIKAVTWEFDYRDLLRHRDEYKHQLLNVIGQDLNGFVLHNCSITHISLTPSQYLDPDTLLGAEGLRALAKRMEQALQDIKESNAEWKEDIVQEVSKNQDEHLLLEVQQAEKTALHEMRIRHLREQGELDARIIHLEIKLEAETSSSIRWRLKKQLDDLKRKGQGLKTQFEMEEKSVKVLYQRKLVSLKRRDKLPPEK